jgi:hypothetical protein
MALNGIDKMPILFRTYDNSSPVLTPTAMVTANSWIFAALDALIGPLERRYSLALILVKSRVNHATILELDFRGCRVALERECVLHPSLVITLTKY